MRQPAHRGAVRSRDRGGRLTVVQCIQLGWEWRERDEEDGAAAPAGGCCTSRGCSATAPPTASGSAQMRMRRFWATACGRAPDDRQAQPPHLPPAPLTWRPRGPGGARYHDAYIARTGPALQDQRSAITSRDRPASQAAPDPPYLRGHWLGVGHGAHRPDRGDRCCLDTHVAELATGHVPGLAATMTTGPAPGLTPDARGDGQLTASASALEGFTTRCHIFPACG